MERALYIFDPEHLATIGPQYSRVYFGAEFCQYKIPLNKTLQEIIEHVESLRLAFTYVTPCVTDPYLAKLKKHFEILTTYDNVEIVFNDWGVFNLLKREYPAFTLSLGRLLAKQKKDPRLLPLVKRSKDETRITVSQEMRIVTNILQPPPKIIEYYQSSNINTGLFLKYLIDNKVNRVEVDNLLHGMIGKRNDALRVSLYMPYGYITLGRICTTRMVAGDDYAIHDCRRRPCRDAAYKLKYDGCDFTVFLRGNVQYFYKSELPENLAELGVDRVVDNVLLFESIPP